MRTLRILIVFNFVISLISQPIFACAFRKIVNELKEVKATKGSRKQTKDILRDPITPEWSDDKGVREANIKKWEEEIISAAQNEWDKLGIKYKKMPYKGGEALVVDEKGNSPLNVLVKVSKSKISKKNYQFDMVFSPRTLLREWPEKNTFFLVAGSFSRDNFKIHLPFKSVTSRKINPTVHHEFLHAVFDYFAHTGVESGFHGRFYSKDGKKDMWNGTHYTEYMSLEELATFPLNIRLYQLDLKEIAKEKDPDVRSEKMRDFISKIFNKSLSNAVNARHVRTYLGHVLKHIQDKTGNIKTSAVQKGINSPLAAASVKWANIDYQFDIPINGKGTLADRFLDRLKLQYEMSGKLSASARELMDYVLVLKEKDPYEVFTDQEIKKLSKLLLKPRKLTLPYIVLKPE